MLAGHALRRRDRAGIGIEADRADVRPRPPGQAEEQSGAATHVQDAAALRNPADQILERADERPQALQRPRPPRRIGVKVARGGEDARTLRKIGIHSPPPDCLCCTC